MSAECWQVLSSFGGEIALAALAIVTIQGIVFFFTVIFQCRSEAHTSFLFSDQSTKSFLRTTSRLLESQQRSPTQLHQSRELLPRSRHNQHTHRVPRRSLPMRTIWASNYPPDNRLSSCCSSVLRCWTYYLTRLLKHGIRHGLRILYGRRVTLSLCRVVSLP